MIRASQSGHGYLVAIAARAAAQVQCRFAVDLLAWPIVKSAYLRVG